MNNNLISIPEYYKRFINGSVDLSIEPKQCCPFHKEDTPSFSYSPERGTWRCFGACHVGGDVIDLHKKNFKLASREEAKLSLMHILGIKEEVTFVRERPEANMEEVRKRSIYRKAVQCAATPEDYEELDYIMSFYPLNVQKLETFIRRHGLEV